MAPDISGAKPRGGNFPGLLRSANGLAIRMKGSFTGKTKMNTPFLMKLGAVVVALFMNSLILAGAAYVVHAQYRPQTGEPAVACTSKKAIHLHV